MRRATVAVAVISSLVSVSACRPTGGSLQPGERPGVVVHVQRWAVDPAFGDPEPQWRYLIKPDDKAPPFRKTQATGEDVPRCRVGERYPECWSD